MKTLLAAGSLFLVACAAPFVLLVNPKNGTSVECSGVGYGLVPAIAVSNQADSCVKQYEALGYIKAENLTAEQRETLNITAPTKQHRIDPPTVITAPAAKLYNNAGWRRNDHDEL